MTQQGFFLDPPGRRFAYDEDGTNVISFDNNATTSAVSLAQLQTINDETISATDTFGSQRYTTPTLTGSPSWTLHFYFPELRDLTGMFLSWYGWHFGPGDIGLGWSWSANSTQPLDGNWTTFAYTQNSAGTVVPDYRTQITGINLTGVKVLRVNVQISSGLTWTTDFTLAALHIYGRKSVNQTPNRLIYCDAAGNDLLVDEDYGDQPRASTRIWSPPATYNEPSPLYIKNISSSKTATNVTLSIEGLSTDMSTSISLSKDNITYANNITFPTIAPNNIVGPFYVMYAAPGSTGLGLKTARLKLSTVSWQ